jgi:hypothetical protein
MSSRKRGMPWSQPSPVRGEGGQWIRPELLQTMVTKRLTVGHGFIILPATGYRTSPPGRVPCNRWPHKRPAWLLAAVQGSSTNCVAPLRPATTLAGRSRHTECGSSGSAFSTTCLIRRRWRNQRPTPFAPNWRSTRRSAPRGRTKFFRPSFATHLFESGCDVGTVQALLGYGHIKVTMVYAHVLNRGPGGVQVPSGCSLGRLQMGVLCRWL